MVDSPEKKGITQLDHFNGGKKHGKPLDCGVPSLVTHMKKTVVTTGSNL